MRQTYFHSLTEAELAEMRQRLEQATAGPWVAKVDGFIETDGPAARVVGVTCRGLEGEGEPLPAVANAEFIAHAREDMLRLLDEVERLRQRLHERRDRNAACGEFADADALRTI